MDEKYGPATWFDKETDDVYPQYQEEYTKLYETLIDTILRNETNNI